MDLGRLLLLQTVAQSDTLVDPFPVFTMMPYVSSVASMKVPYSLPGVSDGIFIIFRPTKAFLNVRNKKIPAESSQKMWWHAEGRRPAPGTASGPWSTQGTGRRGKYTLRDVLNGKELYVALFV